MRNFPKHIATGSDIRNCRDMVDRGELSAADLLDAIRALERSGFINCPVKRVSEDGLTITTGYCPEAAKGQTITMSPTDRDNDTTTVVINVSHTKDTEAEDGMEQYVSTEITITDPVDTAAHYTARIPKTPSVYDELGITKEEMDKIKEGLENE